MHFIFRYIILYYFKLNHNIVIKILLLLQDTGNGYILDNQYNLQLLHF